MFNYIDMAGLKRPILLSGYLNFQEWSQVGMIPDT